MIIIYGTNNCRYCQVTKDYFKSKDLSYEYFDVGSDNQKREEMTALSGSMSVPVVRIKDKVIIGFNKNEIDNALL